MLSVQNTVVVFVLVVSVLLFLLEKRLYQKKRIDEYCLLVSWVLSQHKLLNLQLHTSQYDFSHVWLLICL